jgi:hypothetical protein
MNKETKAPATEPVGSQLVRGVGRLVGKREDRSMRQKLVTQLEVIYIENHPDHRASGMSATALIYWGFRMGLLTEQEKNDAMGLARED